MLASRRAAPDLEDARQLIAASGARLGTPLHLLDATGSTNDDAKAGAREGAPHGAVWLAETQTRGRGRQGRVWVSPPGENLLFSVLVRVPCVPASVPPLSLACGLAVRDAVARAIIGEGEGEGDCVRVKWPNDVVIVDRENGGFRKVAGILVESVLAGSRVEFIVIGIGVNVHTRDFPPDVATTATSIAMAASGATEPRRDVILADILRRLDHDIEHVVHRGLGIVHGRLSKHDALLGRAVESDDGTLVGVAAGIDPDGRLLVRREDGGIAKVSSGEVRLRLGAPVLPSRA